MCTVCWVVALPSACRHVPCVLCFESGPCCLPPANCLCVCAVLFCVVLRAGPYAQRAAFLLMSWAILGWLVPTLLLLPDAEAPAADASSRRPRFWLLQLVTLPVSKALAGVERGLSILQLPWLQSQSRQQQRRLGAAAAAAGADTDADAEEGGQDEFLVLGMMMMLAWVVVLLTVWLGACFAVRMM